MTVLLDPPLWPRHGTVWGHLISDESLAELHELARRAGIPARGFDADHYDVPTERYPELIALGAVLVDSRELVRRLRASGLRVTARDRREPARGAPAPSPGSGSRTWRSGDVSRTWRSGDVSRSADSASSSG